jgi:hypothetical protein
MTAMAITPTSGHDSTSPPSRRFLVLAFVLSTLFTTVVGGVSSCVLADRQTTRAEKITEMNRFLRSTEDFEPLMRKHVQNIVKGRPLDASREALAQNIQTQHVLLREVSAYVPEAQKPQADQYEATLVSLSDALEDADSPLTAAPLMQQVNNAVVAKKNLTSALREGVGLPG